MKRSFLYASLIALTVITSRYATADLDEGLVLYFTFDNVTGKRILDESGNGLDAEVVKHTQFVEGKYGNAIYITGETEDCVNISSEKALEISEEITMMAWVYHKNWTGSSSQWFDKGSYGHRARVNSYGMAIRDEKDDPDLAFFDEGSGITLILGSDNVQKFITTPNNMEDRTWHHIAGTYQGFTARTYLDGENIFELDIRDPFKFNGVNDEDLRIGCAKNKPEYAFADGTIDEVALYNRALSETEIRTAMRGPLFPVSPEDKVATTWGNIKRKALQP